MAETAIAAEGIIPTENKDVENLIKALKGVQIGGLWYISYQSGEAGGQNYNQFTVKRGYLTVKKEFLPWFSGRITPDITTVKDQYDPPGDDKPNSLDGSIVARIKYLYGQFNLPDFAFFTEPFIEVGVVHMPWLDYEDHVNFYRCQDTMFLERNDLFNSADIGITFVSLFGGVMDEDYQNKVSKYYPGRYDFFDPDNDKKDDENTRYIAGVAYHIDKQHKNMVVIDYDMVDYKECGKSDDKRVQVTLQVAF